MSTGAPTTRFIIPGYDVSGSNTGPTTFDLSGETTDPTGLFLKPDGTRAFVTANTDSGGSADDRTHRYDLSTAWDVSTASFQESDGTTGADGDIQDVFLERDGSRMFLLGAGDDQVKAIPLNTNWTLNGSLSVNNTFDISGQSTDPTALTFSPIGDKMFVADSGDDAIYQYSLSTNWDITSASSDGSFDVSGEETNVQGINFSIDGQLLHIVGQVNDKVFQYTVSNPWDITSSVSLDTSGVSVSDTKPRSLNWKHGGDKIFFVGNSNVRLSEYTLDDVQFDYKTDEMVVDGWDEDSQRYRRLDGFVESDVRAKLLQASFRSVPESKNSNSSGVNLGEIYEKIQVKTSNGYPCLLEPDTGASAPYHDTPRATVVTQGESPRFFRTEKGADRLMRDLRLQGAKWLDPDDARDKDQIDDIASLSDVL